MTPHEQTPWRACDLVYSARNGGEIHDDGEKRRQRKIPFIGCIKVMLLSHPLGNELTVLLIEGEGMCRPHDSFWMM